jgi:AcrR family transcriptional regulator
MVRTRTRDEILVAAAELFTHHGFKGTSLQDIAAGVGCSKATLLYHFESKEAILIELVAPAAQELADLVAYLTTLEAAAAQVAAIEGFVDLVLRHRREAALIYDGTPQFLDQPMFAGLRPLTDTLCATFAGRSTDRAACVAAEVLLGGIAGVAIDKAADEGDDALRRALVDVAERALITPHPKD